MVGFSGDSGRVEPVDSSQPGELEPRGREELHDYWARRKRTRWKMAAVLGGAVVLGGVALERGCTSLSSSHKHDFIGGVRDAQVDYSYAFRRSLMSKGDTFTDEDLLLLRGFFEDNGKHLAEMLFEKVFPEEHYRGYKGISTSPSPESKFVTVSLEVEYGRLTRCTVTFMFDLIKKNDWNASVTNVSVQADGMEHSHAAQRAASAALGKIFTVESSRE